MRLQCRNAFMCEVGQLENRKSNAWKSMTFLQLMKTAHSAMDGKDICLNCGLTILWTVHVEQKKKQCFSSFFIFHWFSSKTNSDLYVKLWKNLHSYTDYCTLEYCQYLRMNAILDKHTSYTLKCQSFKNSSQCVYMWFSLLLYTNSCQ